MPSNSPKPSSSSSAKRKGGSKKGGSSKTGSTSKDGSKSNEPVSLERRPEQGMNPVSILTGFYGSRGERIRHTVHVGALKMPKEALDLIDNAIHETGLTPADSYDLPPLNSVIRPTLDPSIENLIVTELSLEEVEVQEPTPEVLPGTLPPEPKVSRVMQTKVVNRTIQRSQVAEETVPTERIRGGGEDDETMMDVDTASAPADMEESAMQAPVATGAQEVASTPAPAVAQSSAAQVLPTVPQTSNPVTTAASTHSVHSAPASSSGGTISSQVPVVLATTQGSTPPVASVTASSPAPAATIAVPKPAAATTTVPSVPQPAKTVSVSTSTPTAAAASSGTAQRFSANSGSATTSTTPTTSMTLSSTTQANSGTTKVITGTATPAPPAPSSTPIPIQSLATKPEPQWELHRPAPNDETVTPQDQLPPKPDWYRSDGIADIERTMLPEWFDNSASHRTPESYIKARETIVAMSTTVANRNVTSTMVRRSIVGDAGSLQRLRNFLTHFGLINTDAINDSAPTPAILREKYPVPREWDDGLREELMNAVVEQASKRRKTSSDADDNSSFVPVDWEQVALQVGHGVSADECERGFLSMPIPTDSSSADANTTTTTKSDEQESTAHQSSEAYPYKEKIQREFLNELIQNTKPEIIRKATEAAMAAASLGPDPVREAQSGALLGIAASHAAEEAKKTEDELEAVLSHLLDQRMKKLENRMAMMEDVEALLETEKVALEIERRDLYTARCRHWYETT